MAYVAPEVIIYFDFETGGLDPDEGAEPIELAAIALNYHTLEEIGRFDARLFRVLKPENLHPKALSVNGKTLEQVMAAEDPKVVFEAFTAWVMQVTGGKGKALPAAHNSKFDIKFMKWALKTHLGWGTSEYDKIFDYHDICTFTLYYFKKVMTKISRFGRLTDAAKMYGLEHDAHQAMGDVIVGVQLLRILMQEEKRAAVAVQVAEYLVANYAAGSDFKNTDPTLHTLLMRCVSDYSVNLAKT